MIPVKDIHPLTDFKRNTNQFRRRLKKSGEPVVLTVDGRAELIVQDAAAYERMVADLDFAETIKGVSEGLAEARAGKGMSLAQFDREIRKRHKQRKRS